VGTRCADHVTPLYPQKLALTSPTGGGRSVGIVRVWTKATEFVCEIKLENLRMRGVATPPLRNIPWLDLFLSGSRHTDAVSCISRT